MNFNGSDAIGLVPPTSIGLQAPIANTGHLQTIWRIYHYWVCPRIGVRKVGCYAFYYFDVFYAYFVTKLYGTALLPPIRPAIAWKTLVTGGDKATGVEVAVVAHLAGGAWGGPPKRKSLGDLNIPASLVSLFSLLNFIN